MSGWWYVAWWFWTFCILIPLIFIIVIGVLCCAYFGYITVPCVKARYNSGPSKSQDLNNQNQQQQSQQNNQQNQNQQNNQQIYQQNQQNNQQNQS